MKALPFLALMIFTASGYAQENLTMQYHKGDSLLKSGNYLGAYELFKGLESKCGRKDTLYPSVAFLEKSYRDMEDWNNYLKYGLEVMALIEIQSGKIFGEEILDDQKHHGCLLCV